MNKKPIVSRLIGLLLLIGVYTPTLALAQQSKASCPPKGVVRNPTAPLYKIGRVGYSAPNHPREVFIFISIEPKYFVRDDMIALARELNRAYCWEQRVSVIILDDLTL